MSSLHSAGATTQTSTPTNFDDDARWGKQYGFGEIDRSVHGRFPLMDLPAELRLAVYHRFTPPTSVIAWFSARSSGPVDPFVRFFRQSTDDICEPTGPPWLNPPQRELFELLTVCQQITHELLKEVYDRTGFHFYLCHSSFRWMGSLRYPRTRTNVRHVHFGIASATDSAWVDTELRRFVLDRANLVSLYVSIQFDQSALELQPFQTSWSDAELPDPHDVCEALVRKVSAASKFRTWYYGHWGSRKTRVCLTFGMDIAKLRTASAPLWYLETETAAEWWKEMVALELSKGTP